MGGLTKAQRRFGHYEDGEPQQKALLRCSKMRAAKIDRAFLATLLPERSKYLESVDARLRRAWRIHELTKERRSCSM